MQSARIFRSCPSFTFVFTGRLFALPSSSSLQFGVCSIDAHLFWIVFSAGVRCESRDPHQSRFHFHSLHCIWLLVFFSFFHFLLLFIQWLPFFFAHSHDDNVDLRVWSRHWGGRRGKTDTHTHTHSAINGYIIYWAYRMHWFHTQRISDNSLRMVVRMGYRFRFPFS